MSSMPVINWEDEDKLSMSEKSSSNHTIDLFLKTQWFPADRWILQVVSLLITKRTNQLVSKVKNNPGFFF